VSGDRPFAEARLTAASEWAVDYGNEVDYSTVAKWEAEAKAKRLNSAVAARERKAAAKALRDAAEFIETHVIATPGDGASYVKQAKIKCSTSMAWADALRARADEINEMVGTSNSMGAAKALRAFADSESLKDDFGHGEVITKHDVRTALRAEADAIEKGEA